MNNSKIWLVVKPTVGIPIFLSAVAIGSFAVHVAVLSNTTWVADFLSGRALGSSAETAMLQDKTRPLAKATNFDQESFRSSDRIWIEMPDGTRVQAILAPPDRLASAGSGLVPDR